MVMKLLVAGGAGFIGTNLVSRLLELNNRVVVLDNYSTGKFDNLQIAASKYGNNLTVVEHDITEKLPEFKEKFDVIVNLACPASPPVYQRLAVETLRVNSVGTENLLNLARINNSRFIQASTSEIYGNPLVHPQNEDYWGNVNSYGPRSMYDEGKRYAEALIWTYRHNFDVKTGIIRIFNTYGPHMSDDDGRVITNFIYQGLSGKKLTINGDGKQSRSFCYIDDQVEAWIKMINSDAEGPINVGNPDEFSILELAQCVEKVLDKKLEYEYLPKLQDDPEMRCPDITLAKKLLGWEPKVSLETGLSQMVKSIQE